MSYRRALSSFVVLMGLTAAPALAKTARQKDDLPTIDKPRRGPDPDLYRFLGAVAFKTIATATRIDALHIDSDSWQPPRTKKTPQQNRVGGYLVTSVRRHLPPDLATSIKKAVLAPNAYSWPEPGWMRGKGCGGFRPAVVFRFFATARHPEDLFFCFACDDVGISAEPAEQADIDEPPEPDLFFLLADARPGRSTFLELAAKALPDEPTIRALIRTQPKISPPSLIQGP